MERMSLKELSDEIYLYEQRISLARKAALFGIWDWNIVNSDLFWDEIMFDLFKPKDWTGKVQSFYDCLTAEDKVMAAKKLQEAIENGKQYDFRYKVITKEGNFKYIRGKGSVVERDINNKPIRMIGICFEAGE